MLVLILFPWILVATANVDVERRAFTMNLHIHSVSDNKNSELSKILFNEFTIYIQITRILKNSEI